MLLHLTITTQLNIINVNNSYFSTFYKNLQFLTKIINNFRSKFEKIKIIL